MTNSRKKSKPRPAGAASAPLAQPATISASTPAASPSIRDPKKRKGRRYAKKSKKPLLTPPTSSPSHPAPSSTPDRAALIAKRKASLSSLSQPPTPTRPSSSWRRVDLDPELLSRTDQRSELGGLLTLEEIDGSVFTRRMATYDPTQHYGADEKDEEGVEQPPASKRRKTAAQRRVTRIELVPALEMKAVEDDEGEEAEAEDDVEDADDDGDEDKEADVEDVDGAIYEDEGDAALETNEGDEAEEGAEGGSDEDEGVEFSLDDLSDTEADADTKAATAEAQRILSQLHSSTSSASPASPPTSPPAPPAPSKKTTAATSLRAPPPAGPPPPSAWDVFQLHPLLLHALHSLGFQQPTPVQSAVLGPAIHHWKDVIAAAATGSGKSLAFGLPILHHLLSTPAPAPSPSPSPSSPPPCPPALILTPTRELALQIQSHLLSAARYTTLRVIAITGGLSQQKQLRQLAEHPGVVVATPGRLWELMGEGAVGGWEALRWLVLDEADRMVERGHFREVEQVMAAIDRRRAQVAADGGRVQKLQRFFFSATLTLGEEDRGDMRREKKGKRRRETGEGEGMVEQLAGLCRMAGQPLVVDLTSDERVVRQLTEFALPCLQAEKDHHVYGLVLQHPGQKLIVFVNAISCVRRLASLLTFLALPAYPLHAEMQQRQRLRNLDRFKAEAGAILIATDVAARGLDIPAVPLVVHYQLPGSVEVYIHRCGRVARGGREGRSVAMIAEGDVKTWRKVNSVIRGGEDVSKWPLDERLMAVSRERMAVVRKLDAVLNREKQGKAKAEWFERKAAEMEMEVDDEVKEALRKGKGEEEEGRGRGVEEEVRRLRRELEALMRKKVDGGKRPHANFFTLNVAQQLLATEAKQLQGETKKTVPATTTKTVQATAAGQPKVKVDKQVKAAARTEGGKGKPAAKATGAKVRAVGPSVVKEEMKEAAAETFDVQRMEETKDVEAEPAEVARVAPTGEAVQDAGKKLGMRAKKNQRKQRQKLNAAAAAVGGASSKLQ